MAELGLLLSWVLLQSPDLFASYLSEEAVLSLCLAISCSPLDKFKMGSLLNLSLSLSFLHHFRSIIQPKSKLVCFYIAFTLDNTSPLGTPVLCN